GVFLIRRGVVESITTEPADFQGNFPKLIHRHLVVTFERIEQVVNDGSLLSLEQFRIRRAFPPERSGDVMRAGIELPLIPPPHTNHATSIGAFAQIPLN